MAAGDDKKSSASGRQSEPWLSDYVGRASDYFDRAARTSARVCENWGRRSLADGEWTMDTVTADAIEAWEEFTPLVGEGLDLWLELLQRGMRAGRSDA